MPGEDQLPPNSCRTQGLVFTGPWQEAVALLKKAGLLKPEWLNRAVNSSDNVAKDYPYGVVVREDMSYYESIMKVCAV